MVSDFPNPDSLPGGLKKGPPADTGTYYNIWALAEDLVDQCVKNEGEVGWQATGEVLPSCILTLSNFLAAFLFAALGLCIWLCFVKRESFG